MTIATLTMNPALDLSFHVDRIEPDSKLRADAPRRDPGGGGVNVARAIKAFGGEAVAILTAGGHTGAELRDCLEALGLAVRTIPVAEATRENVTAVEGERGRQYRFTFPGARLDDEERRRCLEEVRTVLGDVSMLVISGSLPPGVPPSFLGEVMAAAGERAVPVIGDTSGEALRAMAAAGEGEGEGASARLLKPNLRELGQLAGRSLDREEARDAAAELARDGAADIIVVSLGAEGAWLVTADEQWWAATPEVETDSIIGAGDCMVAGLAMGLAEDRPLEEVLARGVAAGAAAAMTPGTGLARRADAERLRDRVRPQRHGAEARPA